MITQEALQSVAFDIMTDQTSSFTPSNMKQPLNEYLNLKHYCAPVIPTNAREIITKYSKSPMTLKQEKFVRQILEHNLEDSPKATIEQEQKVQNNICTNPSRNQRNLD